MCIRDRVNRIRSRVDIHRQREPAFDSARKDLAMLKRISPLLLLLILCSSITYAQQGRDMAKEKAISAELEALAPQSVNDFKAATEALDTQDYQKAIDLFLKVHQAAPKFDAAIRRLG